MFRMFCRFGVRGGAVVAAVLASIALAFAAAGPATASSPCEGNSEWYAPSEGYPYWRVHTGVYSCMTYLEANGWYTYSMHHWRCGEFNCHSFWVRTP